MEMLIVTSAKQRECEVCVVSVCHLVLCVSKICGCIFKKFWEGVC